MSSGFSKKFSTEHTFCFALLITCVLGFQPLSAQNSHNNYSPFGSTRMMTSALGGNLKYERLTAPGAQMRSFTVPLILPLEASLSGIQLGTSINYTRKEYSDTEQNVDQEGASHFNLDGRFRALNSNRFLLEFKETVQVPLARNKGEVPHEVRLNIGYNVQSEVTFAYYIQRAHLELGLGHTLRLAHKEYNPGETVSAAVHFGYGFGSPGVIDNRRPLNVLMGVTSRYNYYDRLNNETVDGSQHGAIFFAPGLRYKSSSFSLEATVEVPIHQLQTGDEAYQDRVRGNIGIKYKLK